MKEIRSYDFIDALRGYAIVLVVLTHTGQHVASSSRWLALTMSYGAHGVQLFFVASALTLCLSWRQRSMEERSPVRNFFIRRFFRIAPLFYLAILGYLCLYGFAPRYWAPQGINWGTVLLTALFVNGFHPETIDSMVPGGWSIAVEMSFYVSLPFLMIHLTSARRFLLFFCLSLIIYFTSRVAFEHLYSRQFSADQQYLVSNFLAFNFFAQLPVFALGMLGFCAFKSIPASRSIIAISNLVMVLASGAVAWLLPGIFPRLTVHPVYVGALCAIVTLDLALMGKGVLVGKPIRFLGKVSYSMYLIHFAVLEILLDSGIDSQFKNARVDLSLVYFLLALGITALLAQASYVVVERRGVSLGRRIISALEDRDSTKRVLTSA